MGSLKQVTISSTFREQSEYARQSVGNTDTIVLENATDDEYLLANRLLRLKVLCECALGSAMHGVGVDGDLRVKKELFNKTLSAYVSKLPTYALESNRVVIVTLVKVIQDILAELGEVLGD